MDGYIKTSMITSQQWKSKLSFQDLKDITNNFSDERILGKGGFGVVYKGLLDNGEMVAVKKLLQATPISQGQLENELILLKKLEHQNIVRLVGYCYETEPNPTCQNGKSFLAWDTKILLCLEYLPNGSLDKYIKDASLSWHTRWKVIEGISYGLQYLHEHCNEPIIHLDLKPANILLDANMCPKVTDFGLSRLFDQNQTIHTASAGGTRGYMPPEYLRGIITPMWDIFSLGVIIMEVITGHRDYPDDIRKDSEGFIEFELKKWKSRLQKEPGYTSLETDCQKIERCIQIGLICVNPERTKRPTIKKIIDMLEGIETMDWYISNEVVESWSTSMEGSHIGVLQEQVRVCAEIGIECTDLNPEKRPNMRHIVNRLDETKTMDGYIKTGVNTSQQLVQKDLVFTVKDEPWSKLKQLRDLNNLHGSLVIGGLEKVASMEEALEANLAAKEQLTELTLEWTASSTRRSPEVEADILEGLCPPMGLKKLKIQRYQGSRYPDWMVGKQNGGPKDLQELDFFYLGDGPAPQIVEAFPNLRVLDLSGGDWKALPSNMEQLTSLKSLTIGFNDNIQSLPTLPRFLEVFHVDHCDHTFMKSCVKVGHPNWHKIEHIPKKTFSEIPTVARLGLNMAGNILSFWYRMTL